MLLPLAFSLLAFPALQGPSVKDLFDLRLRDLRERQEPDGSYGDRLMTAEVLLGLAWCPRAYRPDDGPFVRDAARFLLEGAPSGDPVAEAEAALALSALDREGWRTRIAEIAAGTPLEDLLERPPVTEWRLDDPALAELDLPSPGETALGILSSLGETASPRQAAHAVARAAIAWQRERARRPAAADLDAVFRRGADYLLEARGSSGFWEVFGRPEPGISALAARALLASERPEARQAALAALDWLKTLQHEDGSIHAGHLPVYVTSVAVSALARSGREADAEAVRRGADYLRQVQADEGEGYSEADKFYGGIGYGNDLRPDLSNLQYALQALKESGAADDDPAFRWALVFLQRSQNRSESNPGVYREAGETRPVRAGNDGGAVYYPGNSPAGMVAMPDGTLVARSYGSMTYALLKCYFFTGLDAGDPRVREAVAWIGRHWTLEVNPGFDALRDPRAGYQGLYYYFLSLAEALQAAGIREVLAADGRKHDWRRELGARLAELQREDGSWVNSEAPRWWEGNPVLCTGYALNTIATLRQ